METMIKKPHGFINEKMYIIPRDMLKIMTTHPLLKHLYITDVGYFPNAKFHYRERLEGSEQFILIINVKGKGYATIDNTTYVINENKMLLIPKHVGHIYQANLQDPWHIYWVHFLGENAYYYLKDYIENTNVYIKNIDISHIPLIISLFTAIFEAFESGMIVRNLIHTSQILSYLLSNLFIYNDVSLVVDRKNTTFMSLMEYMNKNIANNITLDDMAKHTNLSKSQLNLIFKEKTGFSPVDYFIRIRIQEAAKLLNLTNLNINEIAARVGYDDPYYFSRIFKKVMGIPPSQYRNNHTILTQYKNNNSY